MEAYELWVLGRLCIEAIAIDAWLLPAVMEMEPMEVVGWSGVGIQKTCLINIFPSN